MSELHAIHYIPLASTILCLIFAPILLHRYFVKGSGLHMLWWGLGIVAYGIGTGLEATISIFGNTVFLTKAWYIAGALFGGYPLAQGSVYLLLEKKMAHRLTLITLPLILVVAVLVVLSPANMEAFEAHKPGGSVLEWTWVRAFTPFINIYAVIFLVGGAIYSGIRFFKKQGEGDGARALGNASIAFGGLLPGIGGTMAKMGMVEALYIGEFVGLIFIWAGFSICARAPRIIRQPKAEPAPA